MRKRFVPFAVGVAFLCVLVAGASSASANTGWWHLNQTVHPTRLQPGSAQDEVQEIRTTPGQIVGFSEQTNFVLRVQNKFVGEFATEPLSKEFGVTLLSAESIQTALEEKAYGAGNVTVAETPIAHPVVPGEKRFRITTGGASTDQDVAPLRVQAEPNSTATETVITPGHADGEIVMYAMNVGDAAIDGSSASVNLSDVLPHGWRAIALGGHEPGLEGKINATRPLACSLATLSCALTDAVPPFTRLELRIQVIAEPGAASGETNEFHISGGHVPSAVLSRPLLIGSANPYGVEEFDMVPEEEGGARDTRAGSHPFQLTTVVDFNQAVDAPRDLEPEYQPVELPKDVNVKLPPGLIGNPTPFPKCPVGQFLTLKGVAAGCGAQEAVGVAAVTVFEPNIKTLPFTLPVFSLEPAEGEPARFGFYVPGGNVPVILDTGVRTGADYGVTVSSANISQAASFVSAVVTVWGVPGDSRHDHQRGNGCMEEGAGILPFVPGSTGEVSGYMVEPCQLLEETHPQPLLTLPSSCTGPLQGAGVETDSWSHPGSFQTFAPTEPLPALDGCNRLPFEASIALTPDGQAASTPTGLNVDAHVPQDASLNGAGLAPSDVKDISVTLPQGVTLNPAAGDGLQACSEEQIGYLAAQSTPPADLHFTPDVAEPFCPDASKVATVKIKTPLLPNPLEGSVYLATPAPNGEPGMNPFGSLIAMYLVATDPVSGVVVKLPGRVSLDQSTGQITSTFENNPQLPFEDAELHFFGGDRAPLSTPAQCGAYETKATFTPWSGNESVHSSSTFDVTSGPNGSPCPSPLPFVPSLAASMSNINAGSFSPLVTTISRADGNQDIQTVKLHMPPGLSGILSGVKLCPEAQANAGTCGSESLIGHTIVSVGLGGDPFTVTGGQVFLTEHYGGGQFGLSIVNPADAGPFHLGKVIVRASINVDQATAELTITTGQIPHILDGIPLQIKHVNVTVDRPGFTFNPTNCNPQTVTGSIGSVQGASSPVGVPFQVTNCAALKFAPKFSVSTSGKTSKANGASLIAKLSYPQSVPGTYANIARIKVDLPKQLPSRLTTLQKACTTAQFNTNPAGCPAASDIGIVSVTTPLLPVPLTGPAIFVSHGGEAFPSLTMVLQGYGVTVDLVGTTFISKAGITSTTFKTVPDVPFNTFQLTLPQGKFSALAANGNLCTSKLAMPTEFLAQNGVKINQSTPVSVTGCAKKKALSRAQKLAAALKVCNKKAKGKRAACRATARKRYGPVRAKGKTKGKSKA